MYNKDSIKNKLNQLIDTLKYTRKIYCIGHDQIDVDAFFAGLLSDRLFKYLGFKSEFIILQPVVQNETYALVKKFTNVEMKLYEKTVEDNARTLFLVDHYETLHAGKVIGCIDHHPTIKENTYPFSYIRYATASTYMVYELMQAANYPLTPEEAKYIVFAMLVDTVGFRSSKANLEEATIAKQLAKQYNLNYDLLEKASFCLTPINTMTTEEIVLNGLKKYNFNGYNVRSSYLQLYGLPAEEKIEESIQYIQKDVIQESNPTLKMFIFIVFDLLENKTYEYKIYKDCYQEIIHEGILSRGQDIMPKVEKQLNNF